MKGMKGINRIIILLAGMVLAAFFATDVVLTIKDISIQKEIKEQEKQLARNAQNTVELPERQEVTVRHVESFDAAAYLDDTYLPQEYQKYCMEAGERYGIDGYLLMAMAEMESDGDADAGNADGDTGLLQVNPKWHSGRMARLGVTDLTDPRSNVFVAADYLSELLSGNDYNLPLALMKYNMDHERAEELISQGIYSDYAQSVIARAYELRFLKEGGEADDE